MFGSEHVRPKRRLQPKPKGDQQWMAYPSEQLPTKPNPRLICAMARHREAVISHHAPTTQLTSPLRPGRWWSTMPMCDPMRYGTHEHATDGPTNIGATMNKRQVTHSRTLKTVPTKYANAANQRARNRPTRIANCTDAPVHPHGAPCTTQLMYTDIRRNHNYTTAGTKVPPAPNMLAASKAGQSAGTFKRGS